MRLISRAIALACVAVLAIAAPGVAADAPKADAKSADAKSADAKTPEGPARFPADASVKQTTRVGGKTLSYTATAGSLPVRDETGKVIAEVAFTAFTLDGPRDAARPVTFAFNGGPGAASVYLDLGAIGPKRVPFGVKGDAPSDPAVLQDNPGTWLDFTDLVFIDPVGTGFSHSLVSPEETKKRFWATKPDIAYLSRIVYDWLVKTGRLTSPHYVVGESYGGFRGPRITHTLQTELGVGVNGLVLISPLLDGYTRMDGDVSPLPWMINLPAIAAAHLEREGRLTPQAMAEVEAYTRGDYMLDLVKGRTDPAALDRLVKKVTDLTGLDPVFVRRLGGRLETQAYLREVFRDRGELGSRYDSNVVDYDPFPWAPDQEAGDPLLDMIVAPTTSAAVDFTTRIVGWKVEGRYNALSSEVGRGWDRGRGPDLESVTDLRQAVGVDPKLKVLIAHGWNDLSCPWFASVLIADQIPAMGDPGRVQVKAYPGGHMFYSRDSSLLALRADVMALYGVK
jgi:carboxypeptidase C (cathepsin A)